MIDLNKESIQLVVSQDGKTVWVNTDERCILRASKIPTLLVEDNRE